MRARVKADGRLSVVTAFGGREYTKREWRDVPEGFEGEARVHALLEIEPAPTPEPVSEGTHEAGGADLQRSGGRSGRKRDS